MAKREIHRHPYAIYFGVESTNVILAGKNDIAFRLTTGRDTPDINQPKICIVVRGLEIFPHVTLDNQSLLRVYFHGEDIGDLSINHQPAHPDPIIAAGNKIFFDELIPAAVRYAINNAISPSDCKAYEVIYQDRHVEYISWFIERVFSYTYSTLEPDGYLDRDRVIPQGQEQFEGLYEAYVNFLDSNEFPRWELFQELFPEETLLSLSRGNLVFKKNTAILNGKRLLTTSEEIKNYALKHLSPSDYILYKQFRDNEKLNLPI